jgi:hypothetical protein
MRNKKAAIDSEMTNYRLGDRNCATTAKNWFFYYSNHHPHIFLFRRTGYIDAFRT